MSTKTVGFPLYQGCTLLDFAGATQVFTTWASGYETLWIAADTQPVTTTENIQVIPQATFGQVLTGGKQVDVLFVPGGSEAVAELMFDPVYIGFLKSIAPRCAWAGSVCTGAFLLAAAGLLDDCRATTYWSQIENLALFPKLRVESGYPRWVIDEDHHRFTGGGVSSSIDLALELVQRLQGVSTRQSAQLRVQYAPEPPLPLSGDPCNAPLSIVTEVLKLQVDDFIAPYRDAVEKLIGRSCCGSD